VSGNVQNDGEVESDTLTRGLDNIFSEEIGDALREFSVWKDKKSTLKRQFFVVIAISEDFKQGRYINILKFTNEIIKRRHYIDKELQVSFSFSSSVGIECERKLWKLSGFLTPLLISYTAKQINISEGKEMPVYISESFLYYRFSITRNEITADFGSLPSFYLKKKLAKINLQITQKHIFITFSMNIFSEKDASSYKFISKTSRNERNDISSKEIKEENTNENIDKSLVATIATVAFIAFVLITRHVLKQCTVGHGNTNLEELVNDTRQRSHSLSGENETAFNGDDSANAELEHVNEENTNKERK
jgi:hypothetical protein